MAIRTIGSRLALAVAGVATALTCGAHAMSAFDDAREFALPGPGVFPRFVDMVQRYASQFRSINGECTSDSSPYCDHVARWAELINEIESLQGIARIERVNSAFNSFAYISDWQNWNVVDYWATPLQFYDVDGDCEDFAIAKYYTLRGLGVPIDVMRIVVLYDENLKIHHAVLAVNTGSDVLVLDNQISGVVSASRIAHYTPIMSINEVGAWRHR